MNENQLRYQVIVLAHSLGLVWHYCKVSRQCGGGPGFPDLAIAGPGGLVFAELKSERGDTTAEQDLWGYYAVITGVPYLVWRPSDLQSGQVEFMLRKLASPATKA